MRDVAFLAAMVALLPLAVVRPFVGVLLWSWISFMNPHRMLYGFAADLPWAAIAFCATLLGCLVAREPKQLRLDAVMILVLVLMVCLTLNSVVALAPPSVVWAKWTTVQKVLLGLLVTASLLTERRRVHALIWIMVIAVGYFGVRGGLFTLLTGGNFRIYGPPQTMIEDNNHLAAALLVTAPLMNYLRLQSRNSVVRWSLAVAMGLLLLAAISSYSRGALLALGAAVVVLWLRSHRKITTGIVLAMCVAGAISFMPEHWVARMETINTYEADTSSTERLVMWDTAFKLALERPLVGSGFMGPYTQEVVDRVAYGAPARAVHSIWFELLGEQGFPTFVIWLGLTIAGLVYSARLVRFARARDDLAWAGDLGRMAQVSVVAYMVSGTFLSLSYWDFYWTLLVVLGAAHALAADAVRAEMPARRRTRPALLAATAS